MPAAVKTVGWGRTHQCFKRRKMILDSSESGPSFTARVRVLRQGAPPTEACKRQDTSHEKPGFHTKRKRLRPHV
eukprot:14603699-Alexandrium_andersonii.AAC.1